MPARPATAAPLDETSTGIQHQGNVYVPSSASATAAAMPAIAQHADLDGVGADIVKRGFDLAAHDVRRHGDRSA